MSKNIHFTNEDIEVLKHLLEKVENGNCSTCTIKDDSSGLHFIADDRVSMVKEIRLLRLIIATL